MPEDPLFMILDGSSFLYRAFHTAETLTRSDGLPTGAVTGFCNMLWNLMTRPIGGRWPTHATVAFDYGATNFRNKISRDYKAHRASPPEALAIQFGLVRECVRAFGIKVVEQQGFEADDLIATYVRIAEEYDVDSVIVASDKDLMQLIRPGIRMLDTMKGKLYDRDDVVDKFGVAPIQVPEVQALCGDAVDNVPGIPGVGPKIAAGLINDFGTVADLLAHHAEIENPRIRNLVADNMAAAELSLRLVLLNDYVPVPHGIDDFEYDRCNHRGFIAFMKAMGMVTLPRRVAEDARIDDLKIPPDQRLTGRSAWHVPRQGLEKL